MEINEQNLNFDLFFHKNLLLSKALYTNIIKIIKYYLLYVELGKLKFLKIPK